ncbi:MAG: 3-phosphoshikimate 1-carboxyvinyltransferase [Proteobacteria bacterium]|nr:3-phosphoshikimate 1-carboxyvinyltransferase [Pseudomonadota bacterium]MDE3207271.1 3-phosphoshikimate 1-carboxyvinyltransferase [Pseudomonadota bacterium]
MHYQVEPGGRLTGQIQVPGDKSISHRAIMFGSLAQGVTRVQGFLEGEDALSTMNAFRAMGVRIEGPKSGQVVIHGVGMRGLKAPSAPLDLGNSGTSMRLLAGLLSAQTFPASLVGDGSLMRRPMLRVAEPLGLMGARIHTAEKGYPPLDISPVSRLHGIEYELPVASAQVKSALLLAGLYAQGQTVVTEPAMTRDHTERMLQAFGYAVEVAGLRICVRGGGALQSCQIDVPGDISSAAFFMVGATIAKDSDITLTGVGINPSRTGIIDILRLMGADIVVQNHRHSTGEPVADIRVRSSRLHGIRIPLHLVPLAIDEFPAIFVAAANASGQTELYGAAELRVKESDRIQTMADGLSVLGVINQPRSDGILIEGGTYHGGSILTRGDHRIAMAFSMAALTATTPLTILDCANVATSFPGFSEQARLSGLRLRVGDSV